MLKQWLVGFALVLSFSVYGHGVCGSTELHAYMIGIKDDLKSLSMNVKSGDHSSAEKYADNVILHLTKSREVLPYSLTLENDTAAEKELYIALIDESILVFNNLKVALKTSNSGDIRRLFGEIGSLRNKGHRQFKRAC
ncbi:cytochrome b562 [Marinomonas sp. C2222]|uniref:Cytochrome b562 n=1 Tax=Marinomonas sargassi TaxID=2984494 RepID=A0ABT2YSC9_9GAMM|nr:cytochrome b562 [Marinomonas sargassi]MCV2402798.1 cytochrome b562 [Marinomonas sargassi]